jgi:hypothetical protein
VLSNAGRPLILNVLVSVNRPVAIRGDHLIGELMTDEEMAEYNSRKGMVVEEEEQPVTPRKSVMRRQFL